MRSKKNIPAIRFTGFDGEWEEKGLHQEVDFYSGLTYSPDNVVTLGGTLVLRSSNVKNGRIVTADNVFVDSSVVNSSNVELGDIIVVVRNGSRDLIGKHARIECNMNDTVIGAFMTGIRPKQSTFINALLDTSTFKKEIDKNLGATINQITIGGFNSMNFFVPIELEQQAIGDYFKNIDHLITQSTKRLEKLRNLKKAYLEKMFPRGGATTPELRFKGFSDEWNTSLFGDFANVAMNRRIFKHQTTPKGEIPFYKIGTFGSSPDSYITRALFEEYKQKYSYPHIGAVLISASGSIGRTIVYDGEEAYFQDSNIVWLEHSDIITSQFLQYYYNIIKWHGIEGSTIKRLYNSNILSTAIIYPSIAEQIKIGNFFRNIDEQIAKQTEKLDKLKNIKKACLDKMFV